MKTEPKKTGARKQRRADVDREIERRGLRVVPLGTNGAVRIVGPGVHILLADWNALTVVDLGPVA